MNKPVVSIFVPAYNNPIYSKKTLQSIVEQDYRPIELFFLDDCSPTPLEPMVEEFRKYENDEFHLFFYRQHKNLSSDNWVYGFDHCTGKYVVNMQHDDWWTDRQFLSEAVDLMERNLECHLCVANSIIENTDCKTMIHLPLSMGKRDIWQILPGDTYINMLGYDRIGVQAWSGIVFNLPVARSMGVFHYPFYLSMEEANAFGLVESDEFFASQFLLSSFGSVAITEKVVSVRGKPENAWSDIINKKRIKTMGQNAFVIYYNLYKADLNGKYAQAVKQRARETIFHFPVEKINLKILKHYNYSKDAIRLMLCSYLVGLYRRSFDLPRHYYSFGRRLLRAIRDRELSQFLQQARGLRRFLRAIFPFLKLGL